MNDDYDDPYVDTENEDEEEEDEGRTIIITAPDRLGITPTNPPVSSPPRLYFIQLVAVDAGERITKETRTRTTTRVTRTRRFVFLPIDESITTTALIR